MLTYITPSNILFKLTNIDSWPEDNIVTMYGAPIADDITPLSSGEYPVSAPKCVVENPAISSLSSIWLADNITIIDLGVSFMAKSPHSGGTGTPAAYSSPELLFDGQASKESDVWTLPCPICNIRTGIALFASFFGTRNEVMEAIVEVLERLPELC